MRNWSAGDWSGLILAIALSVTMILLGLAAGQCAAAESLKWKAAMIERHK